MQRWNFNVTIPLFDWLHGTIAGDGRDSEEPRPRRSSAISGAGPG
jgi:hypothetical protein